MQLVPGRSTPLAIFAKSLHNCRSSKIFGVDSHENQTIDFGVFDLGTTIIHFFLRSLSSYKEVSSAIANRQGTRGGCFAPIVCETARDTVQRHEVLSASVCKLILIRKSLCYITQQGCRFPSLGTLLYDLWTVVVMPDVSLGLRSRPHPLVI